MQVGIFAKTFEVIGAQSVFDAIKSAGYTCTQFNFACVGLPSMPDSVDIKTAESIVAASQKSGIGVVALSGTYNMIHPDPSIRQAGLKRLAVMIESAKAMGIPLVTLCTGTRHPHDQWQGHLDNASEPAWRDLLMEMEKAIRLAEQHGVDLGIEPECCFIGGSRSAVDR
jgi:sugar phosphate isomerase/epimerase